MRRLLPGQVIWFRRVGLQQWASKAILGVVRNFMNALAVTSAVAAIGLAHARVQPDLVYQQFPNKKGVIYE